MKRLLLRILLPVLCTGIASGRAAASQPAGRFTLPLSGEGWYLQFDREASWQHDRLYLPDEARDLTQLPVNPPTGGWAQLQPDGARAVQVPGTVEEYLTVSDNPRPENWTGVSWWFRPLTLPAEVAGKRILLHFESVRMRAEIYLDERLVGYDLIGETPFDLDITDAVRPGTTQRLAVRVTNPGGNFHWQDFNEMRWGDYRLPPGRSFGGILGRVTLDAVDAAYVSDIYMQNQPDPKQVKAIVTVQNRSDVPVVRDVQFTIADPAAGGPELQSKNRYGIRLEPGENRIEMPFDCPEAELWEPAHPQLYQCRVELMQERRVTDAATQRFGFRWFQPEGIGRDAVLRLNGRRMMLRTAISWGYWPATGLYATPEMAEKQVRTAQELGLNMLNFHRNIGSPVVLDKADELGLLYYEEPGAFHSAGHDPFIRAVVNEKLQRMIRRDRSHPSLVIYNLINEFGGPKSQDKELVAKRMDDMRRAHAVDESRVMTFTSGWAHAEQSEEDSKAHLLPFDTTLYRRGWFDNHRAGGPATWEEGYYRSPRENLMYTDNRTEIYMRGEEGAISTPPRIALIEEQLRHTERPGWDGAFWQRQYARFEDYFREKGLADNFGTVDSLTRLMGDVSFEHQGRRIQGMRMQDLGDVYAINGWEAMPYDNHSGIVDIYRNPKGNPATLCYYTQPLYVAVAPRAQFVRLPGEVGVDFYIVNETGLSGTCSLEVALVAPDGTRTVAAVQPVEITGGDRFGELLIEDLPLRIGPAAGLYRVEARLADAAGTEVASGHDEVLGVAWRAEQLAGRGALYGRESDPVAQFYRTATGRELPAFDPAMGRLDWIVVTRPSLDAPHPVPVEAYRGAVRTTYYRDGDIQLAAGVDESDRIDWSFADGAQPHALLPANQPFSLISEGRLVAPRSGVYSIGVACDNGVRLTVRGERLIDEWGNKKPLVLSRAFVLEEGEEIDFSLQYSHRNASGYVRLLWAEPGDAAVLPQTLLDRVAQDGTTMLLLDEADSWMNYVDTYTGCGYRGFYTVGSNWVGGIHFVREHPLFAELPVNCAMNWPYQELVRDGDRRLGVYVDREELIAGSYRSTPFHLGTAVGSVPCGRGRIYYSFLHLTAALNAPAPAAEVARKLFCNFVEVAARDAAAAAN